MWTMDAWNNNSTWNRHNGRGYRVRVTKIKHAITRMKRHIKPTDISTTDYLWIEMAKANQTLAVDRLNELADNVTQLYKSDQYNGIETEEKNSVSKDDAQNMPHTVQLKKTCIHRKHRHNKTK